MSEKQATIVIGVIGADCHAVGNKILDRIFTEAGFKVVNLGVMVSQDEYISAAIETKASAILVSSLYGQGKLDCQGFRERCTERGLEDIIVYVGGNLVIGKNDFETTKKEFLAMGFDRVFSPDTELSEVVKLLKEDIAKAK